MTLTADTYGEDFLENGELDLFEEDPDHPCNQVKGHFDGYGDADIHDGVGVSGLGSGRELLQQIWGGHCQTPAGVSLIIMIFGGLIDINVQHFHHLNTWRLFFNLISLTGGSNEE